MNKTAPVLVGLALLGGGAMAFSGEDSSATSYQEAPTIYPSGYAHEEEEGAEDYNFDYKNTRSRASGDMDCADFGSQDEAQEYYEEDTSDPSGLDRDGDGIVCESL